MPEGTDKPVNKVQNQFFFVCVEGGGADGLKCVWLPEDKTGSSGRMAFIEMRQERSANELSYLPCSVWMSGL